MRHLLRAHGRCAARAFCYRRLCSASRARRAFPPGGGKAPSPEAVNEWESAVFIARANGAALFAWRIVSSDGTALYDAAAAPEYFPGLRVQGCGHRHAHASRHSLPRSTAGRSNVCSPTMPGRKRSRDARRSRSTPSVRPRRRSRRPRRTRLPPRSRLRRRRSLPRRSQPRSPRPRPLPRRKRPCRRRLPPPPRPRRFRAARCSVCLPVSLRSRSFSARSL